MSLIRHSILLMALGFLALSCGKAKLSTVVEKGVSSRNGGSDDLVSKSGSSLELGLRLFASIDGEQVDEDTQTFTAAVGDIIWLEIETSQNAQMIFAGLIDIETNLKISNPQLLEPVLPERQRIKVSKAAFSNTNPPYLLGYSRSNDPNLLEGAGLSLQNLTPSQLPQALQLFIASSLNIPPGSISLSQQPSSEEVYKYQIDFDVEELGNRRMPDLLLWKGGERIEPPYFEANRISAMTEDKRSNPESLHTLIENLSLDRFAKYSAFCKNWGFDYDYGQKTFARVFCSAARFQNEGGSSSRFAIPLKVTGEGETEIALVSPLNYDENLPIATGSVLGDKLLPIFPKQSPTTILKAVLTSPQEMKPLVFNPVSRVQPSQWIISNSSTFEGFKHFKEFAVSQAEYSLNGGPWKNTKGVAVAGDQIRLRVYSASQFNTTKTGYLSISDKSYHFSTTTRSASTSLSEFSFDALTQAPIDTLVNSNLVTLSGFETSLPISIQNGEYSVAGGPFTTNNGTVAPGSSLRIRLRSAPTFNSQKLAIITVGSSSETFSVVTRPASTTTTPFSFPPSTGVERSILTVSSSVTLSGHETAVPISVTGGEYSLNGGAFTAATGLAPVGASLRVRVLSSANFNTKVSVAMSVGGVDTSFDVTTRTGSTQPLPYSFSSVSNAELNTSIESAAVTLSGYELPVGVSITGGEYSVNNGSFTSSTGTLAIGSTVKIRVQSAATFNTSASARLTVGGVAATFLVRTRAARTQPNSFQFRALTGVEPSTITESESLTLSGYETTIPISITGGEYSINEADFTSAPGNIPPDARLKIRLRSSATFSNKKTASVTVGSFLSTFDVTSRPASIVPKVFTFPAVTGVEKNILTSSAIVIPEGFEVGIPISVKDGEYSINASDFTSAAGIVSPGASIQVRRYSSSNVNTPVTLTLTVGTYETTFTISTRPYSEIPKNFVFNVRRDVNPNILIFSNVLKMSGFDPALPISIVGANTE